MIETCCDKCYRISIDPSINIYLAISQSPTSNYAKNKSNKSPNWLAARDFACRISVSVKQSKTYFPISLPHLEKRKYTDQN